MLYLACIWTAIVAGLSLLVILRDEPAPAKGPDRRRPEPRIFPYSRRNYFFSAAERSLYEILRRLTPEHTVFAKVRLAELVYIRESVPRQAHLSRIDRRQVDFVVCDKNLAPVVAIELDDASHQPAERRVRDQFVDEVLAAASLPVIHVPERAGYVLDEIHQLLAPYLRIGTLTL
jgi:hypothetical protein